MARPTLTPEERAEREAEKAAANAHKRSYKKVTPQTQNNSTQMENNEGQNNQVENPPVQQNTVVEQTNTVKTEPPVENNSTAQPNNIYKPFGANTEDRNYATPKVDQNLTDPIPEPSFDMPQVDMSKTQTVDFLGTGQGTQQTASQQAIPANPALNQATEQERRFAAEQMADTMIAGYDKAHALGRWFLKKSDEDLMEDHAEGKIDLNIEIEMGAGPNGNLTLGQFNSTFNEQIDKEFVVDEAWKNRVRPPLVRICEKNGWGMTDEQTIAFAVIEDVSTKVGLLIGLKKTYNKIFNMYAKINEDKKKELQEIADIELAKKKAAAEAEARMEAEYAARLKHEQESKKTDKTVVSSGNSKETMSA